MTLVPSNGLLVRRGEKTVLRQGVNLNATVHALVYRVPVYLYFPSRKAPYQMAIYRDVGGLPIAGWDTHGTRHEVVGHHVPDYSGSLDVAWRAVRVFFETRPDQTAAFFASLERQAAGPGDWVRWPRVLIDLADRLPEALSQALVVAIRGDV